MRNLYLFNWPSHYGGADTKVAHLIRLLAGHVKLTVVANDRSQLDQAYWTGFLKRLNVEFTHSRNLPEDRCGVALSLCNTAFLSGGLFNYAVERNWPIIWSSEMMWRHPAEDDLLRIGLFKRLLYVSEVQKAALHYESEYDVSTRITGNYIDPDMFPFRERSPRQELVIGRLSRADWEKYPVNFPAFYEELSIPHARYRVMAWSDELRQRYRWHSFGSQWELLEKESICSVEFLQSLDLFIYPLGHTFTESWGRSTVEAMLCGAIPLVPAGHNFSNLIRHGETGFICQDFQDYQAHAQRLAASFELRARISKACREHAEGQLCNASQHRETWLEAIDV